MSDITFPPPPPTNSDGYTDDPGPGPLPPGVSLDHSFCPPDRPFPISWEAVYAKNPDLCVAYDPCTEWGTTLWHIASCDPDSPTTTSTSTTVVAVTDPPTLPATGTGTAVALTVAIAAFFIAVGAALRRLPRHQDRP